MQRRDDYTTVASVLDVEAIRRALDLPKPSLLGVSYGTWVVQTYAALFPDLVQAAVIDGIMPFHLDPWSRTVHRRDAAGPSAPLRTDRAVRPRRGRRAGAPASPRASPRSRCRSPTARGC